MITLKLHGIEACVFDAYGTLFDVNSAARAEQYSLGERWQPLAELWRAKQLQYTWLRGLGGRHADFWQVTGEALDFAMATMKVEDSALRERLMNLYLVLSAYPEVFATLKQLKAAGMKIAILSNGAPSMLAAAAANAGIAELLDAVLSVEEVKVYKPHPAVYGLACERLNVAASHICFCLPTAGMLTPQRRLASTSCGATASAKRLNKSRRRLTDKLPLWPSYRISY